LYKNKKILALVPARSGSKGIKNKNLRKVNNKSLIEYTSNFIDKLKIVDEKILSSDGPKIINEGKKYNFNIVKRPKKLSSDNISDYQVIKHILSIKEVRDRKFDYLLYLQPTSPIRKISHIKKALKNVIEFKMDSAWSVTKIDKKNNPLKVFKIKDNLLKLFLNNGKKIIARQQLDDAYIRNGVFYIFSIKELIKQKSIYLKKTLPSITSYKTCNIDNLADLKEFKDIVN
tara:strand:- start:1380 stop:2069 length:690 start_codon:yes stop_codon:yes gene_type:complete